VDEFMLVDTDAVCAAIKDVFVDTRSIVDPPARWPWRRSSSTWPSASVAARPMPRVLCGANMNFDRLRFVAERPKSARSARRSSP
jgi:threonine dehydratase